MVAAWAATLDSCDSSGCVEIGFYIFYNHTTRTCSIGEWKIGERMECEIGTAHSVDLGEIPPENINEVCAFFHTHTSLQYATQRCQRDTGSSLEDEDFASTALGRRGGLPGLLYDYKIRTIYNGYPKTSDSTLYTFGPNRRNPIEL